MAAIEDGMYTPALKERMKGLEKRKAEIGGLLAGAEGPIRMKTGPSKSEICDQLFRVQTFILTPAMYARLRGNW